MDFTGTVKKILMLNHLVTAFAAIGLVILLSYSISKYLTKGRLNGSSIAILSGLILAYAGGSLTGGSKGISDVPIFAGIGLLGGSMMRDFTIVATAFGADLNELRKTGVAGIASLILGVLLSFAVGVLFALLGGYSSPEDVATIGAGAVTFVVGPVTGAALGADSSVIALSVGIGVVKSIAVIVITPLFSRVIKISSPREALIFGGLLGTTSGTSAAMAAINPALVPYAAMTSTFYTGLGCLVCPSVLYFVVAAIL